MVEHQGLDRATGFRFLEYRPRETPEVEAVVVYLHGSGERGDDLSLVKRYGLPALLARSEVSVNCAVVCPQLEAGAEWGADRVARFIEATTQHPHKTVLIGYSLGGSGVCEVVSRRGPLVKLAVAIAGQAPRYAQAIQSGVNFFAIQGALDPWPCTSSFVASINALGGATQTVAGRLQPGKWRTRRPSAQYSGAGVQALACFSR